MSLKYTAKVLVGTTCTISGSGFFFNKVRIIFFLFLEKPRYENESNHFSVGRIQRTQSLFKIVIFTKTYDRFNNIWLLVSSPETKAHKVSL